MPAKYGRGARRRQNNNARGVTQRPTPEAPGWTGWTGWKACAAILLLACIAYLPALKAGFIWDDDDYVTGNMALRTAQGLVDIWLKPGTTPQYYPLVHTTFWLEYRAWELWAVGYHAVNILLHAVNACLVFLLLRRLVVPGAWVVAAVFALHPVHVESVVWVTERKNVLSGLFYLLSALLCMRAWGLYVPRNARPDSGGENRAYILALITFIAALLSKTVTATLPAAVLLLVWWKRGRIAGIDWLRTLPFFVLGAVFGAVTVWMEKTTVGAKGFEWDLNFAERILIAGRAVWFYATKLAAPFNLTFIYPKWQLDTGAIAQWAFPIAFFLAAGVLFALRKRIGRAPLTALLFFAGTLFPALGFFDTYPMRYSFVADHFQYLASLGLLALLGPLAMWGWKRAGGDTTRWIGGAIIASLGYLTWMQCGIYKDVETLWRDTLKKNKGAGIAHINLGNLYAKEKQYEKAHQHYMSALAINELDDYAHYNAGVSFYEQGDIDSAVQHYLEAIRIRPDYVEAHFNLGKALEESDPEDAMETYEEAVRLAPEAPDPRVSLAAMLANQGRTEEAEQHYKEVLSIAPAHPVLLFNYSALLINNDRPQEAIPLLQRLVALQPDDAEARQVLDRAMNPPETEELSVGPAEADE